MYKTNDLLDRLKASYHLPSDYATAKKLGISRQSVSNYRCNRKSLEDKLAVQVAELLGLQPFVIMASMRVERAERTRDESAISFWQDYANMGENSTMCHTIKSAPDPAMSDL